MIFKEESRGLETERYEGAYHDAQDHFTSKQLDEIIRTGADLVQDIVNKNSTPHPDNRCESILKSDFQSRS